MKTISINQPAYIPWTGYFERIAKSDVHVILDHVQFEKNSLVNRNYIASKSGLQLLTIPVLQKGYFQNLPINDVSIDLRSKWSQKHLKSLEQNYSKAKNFQSFFPLVFDQYNQIKNTEKLIKVIDKINFFLFDFLKIKTKIYRSSDFAFTQKKSNLILEICKHYKCDNYLSGPMGKNYLNLDDFNRNGISVMFHDYIPRVYRRGTENLDKNLSILDFLFHCENIGLNGDWR